MAQACFKKSLITEKAQSRIFKCSHKYLEPGQWELGMQTPPLGASASQLTPGVCLQQKRQIERDGSRSGPQRFVLEPLLRLKLFWPSPEESIHGEFVPVWVGRTIALIWAKG